MHIVERRQQHGVCEQCGNLRIGDYNHWKRAHRHDGPARGVLGEWPLQGVPDKLLVQL
jgi:hypothetical protein